jgi:hypothetical protein
VNRGHLIRLPATFSPSDAEKEYIYWTFNPGRLSLHSFALGYYLLRFQRISVWNIRVNPC